MFLLAPVTWPLGFPGHTPPPPPTHWLWDFTWTLTLSLTGSWPPSISLLEACSGPLKRATLTEKRLFWWRHCRSYKASASEERAISTNFPPFPLNRVHRSLGTSTGGLFRPTGGKGEGTTIGGGGERIGSPINFTSLSYIFWLKMIY